MSGITRITRGIISPKEISAPITYNVTRVYQSIKIDINKQRPTVIIRPIKQKINIIAQCYKE